ncbi:hypothetical protein OKW42_001601 [Paraburkholderia sp. WC7.3d]
MLATAPTRIVPRARPRIAPQLRRVRQQGAADRRQLSILRMTFEQRAADVVFEILDGAAPRGLAEIEKFGSAAKAARLGDRDERAQLQKIESHASMLGLRDAWRKAPVWWQRIGSQSRLPVANRAAWRLP